MMPKRFTASEKWADNWFRSLETRHKLLWSYMLDMCDYAGLWDVDLTYAHSHIQGKGETLQPYDEAEVLEVFIGRVEITENKWFIPKFVHFQYGVLKENSAPHQRVLERLQRYGVYEFYKRWLAEYLREIGKDVTEKPTAPPVPKIQYAEDVSMTEEEYKKLGSRLGSERAAKECIEILNNYKLSKGRRYESDYRAILNWVVDAWKDRNQKSQGRFGPTVTAGRKDPIQKCPYCKAEMTQSELFAHQQEGVCPNFKTVKPETIRKFREELEKDIEQLGEHFNAKKTTEKPTGKN